MKAMWTGILATFAIAVVAGIGMQYAGFSAAEQGTSANVRLD